MADDVDAVAAFLNAAARVATTIGSVPRRGVEGDRAAFDFAIGEIATYAPLANRPVRVAGHLHVADVGSPRMSATKAAVLIELDNGSTVVTAPDKLTRIPIEEQIAHATALGFLPPPLAQP